MTAQALWEAAFQQGYTKSVETVPRWLCRRRGRVNRGQRIPRHATGTLSARIHEDPPYRLAWTLTRHFQTLVIHQRGETALATWCRAAEASGVPVFPRFAETLRADWDAVVAAFPFRGAKARWQG
ncbi:transposase [Sulfobacillus harzensis]|uniref:Transposase n=1 Tax=Sulfobacillus harzensis TaxID=2729629 RepID=A0A7Y0L2G1_9FIRM|nr:transposase [Sulfobacillus harzensis]NMP22056.1 transposase [Sulfobacillus harzensis]